MSLKKQIDDKLNQALKAKDKNTYPTLRLVLLVLSRVLIKRANFLTVDFLFLVFLVHILFFLTAHLILVHLNTLQKYQYNHE